MNFELQISTIKIVLYLILTTINYQPTTTQ
jgi:hypothetical protein